MTAPTRTPGSRAAWGVLAVLLAVQCVFVLSQVGRRTTSPHDVPVVVQGPALVAQEIAARTNRLQGHPLRATVLPAGADAGSVVRDGTAAGALVVDVRATHDRLYVSSVADPDLNRLLETFAHRVGTPLDRPHTTTSVAPREHPQVGRGVVVLAVDVWLLVGFLVAMVLALARPAWSRARTAALLVGASVVTGLVVAAVAGGHGAPFVTTAVLGSGVTLAVAVATTALDALVGLVGVAIATTVLVFFGAPLFTGRDPRLLPTPWRQVAPWTPHGAASDLAGTVTWFGWHDVTRSLVLLTSTLAVGAAAWTASRPGGTGQVSQVSTWTGGSRSGRMHAAAVAAPLVLAVVAGVLLAPAGTRVVSATPVQGASVTECLPRRPITTVDQLNQAILSVRGQPSFEGADVGADVELQDGRRLWLFADTLRAPDFDGQKFVRNSMLLVDPHCLETVLPADHGALVPDRGTVGYWPMSVASVHLPGYDVVGVATQRVRTSNKPDGIFAFQTLGPAMAVFVVPLGKTPQLIANQDIGPDKVDTTRPMWGAASAIDGDWVYLYGTARPDKKGIFGYSLEVARTKIDDLLHPERWRYWDGRTWQGDPSRARVLIPYQGGVSQTLSVFRRGGRWYAVSKRDEVLGTDLVVWTAPAPNGPFDHGTKVASLPSDPSSGELRYMPLAHPTLMPSQGGVLVSYSRNNTDAAKVTGDPFLYRPLFVKVHLPR